MVDLRYHWVRQKRLQGSHGTNDEQAIAYNDLVRAGAIDPCLGQVSAFDEVGDVHGADGRRDALVGNAAILIGAPTTGSGSRARGSSGTGDRTCGRPPRAGPTSHDRGARSRPPGPGEVEGSDRRDAGSATAMSPTSTARGRRV